MGVRAEMGDEGGVNLKTQHISLLRTHKMDWHTSLSPWALPGEWTVSTCTHQSKSHKKLPVEEKCKVTVQLSSLECSS